MATTTRKWREERHRKKIKRETNKYRSDLNLLFFSLLFFVVETICRRRRRQGSRRNFNRIGCVAFSCPYALIVDVESLMTMMMMMKGNDLMVKDDPYMCLHTHAYTPTRTTRDSQRSDVIWSEEYWERTAFLLTGRETKNGWEQKWQYHDRHHRDYCWHFKLTISCN